MKNLLIVVKNYIMAFIKKLFKKPMFIELILCSVFTLAVIFMSVSGSEGEQFKEDFDVVTVNIPEETVSPDDDWYYEWDELDRGDEISLSDKTVTVTAEPVKVAKPTSTPKPSLILLTPVPESPEEVVETPSISEVPDDYEAEQEIVLDPNHPVIITDFESEHITTDSIETMTVTAYYSDGQKVPYDKLYVVHNNNIIGYNMECNQSYSYTFNYTVGINNIEVFAVDELRENHSANYTVYYDNTNEPSATISVDAACIGLGYMVKPTQVKLEEGQPIAYYIKELLSANGFTTFTKGSLTNNYEFIGLYKRNLFLNIEPNLPTDLIDVYCKYDPFFKIDISDYYDDFIKNGYFTDNSRWVLEINGEQYLDNIPEYIIQDGDVIKLRYTLADGVDLLWLNEQIAKRTNNVH